MSQAWEILAATAAEEMVVACEFAKGSFRRRM